MERSNFTFYESFAAAARRIKKKNERCDFYDAVVNYALYGEEPDMESMPDIVAIAIELIKPNLDSSRRKAENGKQGRGAEANDKQNESKRKANEKQNGNKTEANGKQTESKTEANDKQNGNKKEKEKEIEIEIENKKEIEGEYEGETRKETKKKRDAFEEFAAVDTELLKALRDFEQMRTKIKKPLTDRAKEMLIEKLKTFPPDHWVRILEQSVMHDWQGIFELKGEKQTYSKNDLRNIQPAPDTFMSKEDRMKMMGGKK